MATRTTYTSTITVPVYASWKCENCGEVNFATGTIACKCQETTSSWSSSKQRETEERAAKRARASWANDAYRIISDPSHSGHAMYSNFFLQNTNCTKCKKKPRWNKNVKFLPLIGLMMPVALISGIVAFTSLTSISAWLVFIASAGFIVWGIAREEVYNKMMVKLPQKYLPVIGSLNEELRDHAARFGKTIPTPDECIETVMGYDRISQGINEKAHMVFSTTTDSVSSDTKAASFCRKCGTKLAEDSDFCHKCGTKIIK